VAAVTSALFRPPRIIFATVGTDRPDVPGRPVVPVVGLALFRRVAHTCATARFSRLEQGMTPLRQRFLDELRLRNYAPRTMQAYGAGVVRLARHFGRSPDQLGPEEVRTFLLALIARGVSWSLFNQTVCAWKLFYPDTLRRPEVVTFVRYGKRPPPLPGVLAPAEGVQLFVAARPGVERVLLQTDYALGLRVSELVHLRVEDLDSRRMVVQVHAGKGRKDRLVPLSPKLLEELRGYGRPCRPACWLLPGAKPGTHRRVARVQRLVRRVARRAGLTKPLTVHTLRMASAYYYTFQRSAYFQGNSPWSGDILGSWRP
jgi:integrase/recombinase XerD